MKFSLENKSNQNVSLLLRRAGYRYQKLKGRELIFFRPLSQEYYPHFHLYLIEEEDKLFFSLHLDQKRPSYKGSSAHSGEYGGELVEKEAQRIKDLFND